MGGSFVSGYMLTHVGSAIDGYDALIINTCRYVGGCYKLLLSTFSICTLTPKSVIQHRLGK